MKDITKLFYREVEGGRKVLITDMDKASGGVVVARLVVGTADRGGMELIDEIGVPVLGGDMVMMFVQKGGEGWRYLAHIPLQSSFEIKPVLEMQANVTMAESVCLIIPTSTIDGLLARAEGEVISNRDLEEARKPMVCEGSCWYGCTGWECEDKGAGLYV